MCADTLIKAVADKPNGLIKVFEGHTEMLRDVAISADQQRILSSSIDQTVRLWDVNSGEEIKRFEINGFTLLFTSDGQRALIGRPQGNLSFIDLNNGAVLAECQGGEGYIDSLAFSPDETTVLFTDALTDLFHTWDFKTVVSGHKTKGNKKIKCLSMADDGKSFISGCNEKSVKLWDYDSKTVIQNYKGAKRAVKTAAFYHDQVICAHEMSDVKQCDAVEIIAWDRASGNEVNRARIRTGRRMNILAIALTPDLSGVLTGSHDTTLRFNRLNF